jgi:hypothetical protein
MMTTPYANDATAERSISLGVVAHSFIVPTATICQFFTPNFVLRLNTTTASFSASNQGAGATTLCHKSTNASGVSHFVPASSQTLDMTLISFTYFMCVLISFHLFHAPDLTGLRFRWSG